MSNQQDRIHELKVRQVFYGSSMVCKLNSVNGEMHYKIYAWINQGITDNKSLVLEGRYNNEDPNELFQVALLQMGLKGIKCGKPVNVSQKESI